MGHMAATQFIYSVCIVHESTSCMYSLYTYVCVCVCVCYVLGELAYTVSCVDLSDSLLAHNFKQTTGTRFSIHTCEVCQKGFAGFMKHALKCVGKFQPTLYRVIHCFA